MSGTQAASCTAVLLAAGVGRRLADAHPGPKVMLDFGGRSLLQRHIQALAANGVRRLSITVGYEAQQIRDAAGVAVAALDGAAGDFQLSFIDNPDFRDGSLVSLHCQREVLEQGGDILLMDGDVLHDSRMIRRLLGEGAADGVLLVDREIEPGDEPVKVCFDDAGAIVDFRKIPTKPHAWFGESVGFFRFSSAIARTLAERCAGYVTQGLVKTEYEEAIRDLILDGPERFGWRDVSDLPWTEIDFEADVARAREHILPQLRD